MNKADLIEAVAIKCDISKLAAQRAVDAMIDTITNSLQNGKEVQLLGFGTFSVVERAARKGRNLRTNKSIEIPARTGRTSVLDVHFPNHHPIPRRVCWRVCG